MLYQEGSAERANSTNNALAYAGLAKNMAEHLGGEALNFREDTMEFLAPAIVRIATAGFERRQRIERGEQVNLLAPTADENAFDDLRYECDVIATLMNMAPELWQ